MTTLHPFGTTITDATLRQTFAPLNQWEDKYRQLILLGKKLPTLTDERKAQAHEIAGCENRVWLRSQGLSALSEAVLAAARER